MLRATPNGTASALAFLGIGRTAAGPKNADDDRQAKVIAPRR